MLWNYFHLGACILKYVSKRYKWKFGIKYATYCFFYLNIIYIFVAKIEQYWKYITPNSV